MNGAHDLWAAVDHYFNDLLIPADPNLDAALADSVTAGMPAIHVAPNQGKLIQLLLQMQQASKVLEIGTLGGYSTIWIAQALPDHGRVVSLEIDAARAEVARRNVARAGQENKVEIRVGKAADTLPELQAEGHGPFDFIFVDADKPSNPLYLDWALRLSRPGTVIFVDNVVRNGAVADSASQDPNIVGVQRLAEMVRREPRLSATALQTVGEKGHDGFVLARVIA